MCLCKMFYQVFKDKTFYNFLKKIYGQQKIFYKFDNILHANKYLKIEKHFLENILFQTNSLYIYIYMVIYGCAS